MLEINVDEDQLEDRIDEALEYWRQYHHEGIEKLYLKQQIRASKLTLQQPNAQDFKLNDFVTGQTSGATGRITNQTDAKSKDNTLYIRNVTGTFIDNEVVQDSHGTTATLAANNAFFVGEVDKKYVELPDSVYGVSRVIPFAGTQTSKSMFDIQYQLRLHDLYDLASTSIIYYKSVMGHLALLDLELNGKPLFRFNRMQSRIFLDIDWNVDVAPGDYVVLDCYRALDPSQFTRIWNEAWLKHYATALFKRQWGVNLKKFGGIQLPGGVVLDGQGLYDEAMTEIKDLEEDLMNKAAPLEFFLG